MKKDKTKKAQHRVLEREVDIKFLLFLSMVGYFVMTRPFTITAGESRIRISCGG